MNTETVLATLDDRGLVGRIRRRDHTVWSSDPEEIADRLGWLTLPDHMPRLVSGIEAFASEVRGSRVPAGCPAGDGRKHPGSRGHPAHSSESKRGFLSLYCSTRLYPRPSWPWRMPSTLAVPCSSSRQSPARPLRHVSSTTSSRASSRVIHGTRLDAASRPSRTPVPPLEKLARERGFRRVFTNPPDVVGRFSALSFFGLVPAALAGVDIAELLSRAGDMRSACLSDGPVKENPGARLGATMAAMAIEGRDKLTLLASPSIRSFGLWAEQLIAESTGKDGKGIIPIADEPVLSPEYYGDDRLFVYLRVARRRQRCPRRCGAAVRGVRPSRRAAEHARPVRHRR